MQHSTTLSGTSFSCYLFYLLTLSLQSFQLDIKYILLLPCLKMFFCESYNILKSSPISWLYLKVKHLSKNIYVCWFRTSPTTYSSICFEPAATELSRIINDFYSGLFTSGEWTLMNLYLLFCLSSEVYLVDHSMLQKFVLFEPIITHSPDFLLVLTMPVLRLSV